jgi:hypothetical protein
LITQDGDSSSPFCSSDKRAAISLTSGPSEKYVARLHTATVLHDTPCKHIRRSSQRTHIKAVKHRSNRDIAHMFTVPTAQSLGQPVMGG